MLTLNDSKVKLTHSHQTQMCLNQGEMCDLRI